MNDAIREIDPGGLCAHVVPPSLRHGSSGRGFAWGSARSREPCRVASVSHEQTRSTSAPKVPNVWGRESSYLEVTRPAWQIRNCRPEGWAGSRPSGTADELPGVG